MVVVAHGLMRRTEPFVPGVAVSLPAMPWWLLLFLAIALAALSILVLKRPQSPDNQRDRD